MLFGFVNRFASGFYATLAGIAAFSLTVSLWYMALDHFFPYPARPADRWLLVGALWWGVSIFVGLVAMKAVLEYREGPFTDD